jgi:hypothetical protein
MGLKFPMHLPTIWGMEIMIRRAIALTLRAFATSCTDERDELMREAMELTRYLAQR